MTLTVALAIVAGVVLLAVVVHGAWKAHRAGAQRTRWQPTQPVQRQEPALPPADPVVDGSASSPSPQPAHQGLATPSTQRRGPRIDALVDAIASLSTDNPISGDHVLTHWPATRRAGAKSFQIEGRNERTGSWEMPGPGQRYQHFQAGLQLVNRGGPVNEIEYSEFVQKVQTFADAIGAATDFPDMLDVVARARELDAFSSQHDAQLVVHLRSRDMAWAMGFVQQCASRHGFQLSVSGRMVMPSVEDGDPPVLVLSFDPRVALSEDAGQATLRELSLSLDVAQTPESAEPFAAWQLAVRCLADELGAQVVDEQGNPVTPKAFNQIGTDLHYLYRALESRDLAAGSPAARRLFS